MFFEDQKPDNYKYRLRSSDSHKAEAVAKPRNERKDAADDASGKVDERGKSEMEILDRNSVTIAPL